LQDPPKFTQIGIFGLKTNRLATLPYCQKCGLIDVALVASSHSISFAT
jgi:hypothetical protein